MSKEMLVRSMTNNFLRILKPTADAETLRVMRSKRSPDEYNRLIPLLTAKGATGNNVVALEDGFRVISNYKSVSVRYDCSDQSLIIEKPIFHNMLTSQQVHAFESYVEDSNSWSLKHSLRKLQKGIF